MSNGLAFVTAPSADHKAINRFLTYVRDWQYGSNDRFRIVTTKNLGDLVTLVDTAPTQKPKVTKPGDVNEDFQNSWVGSSITDIQAFLASGAERSRALTRALFLVLDEQSLKDKTCVVAQRVFEGAYEEGKSPYEYHKVRVPWHGAYSMWCNLDIANMDFEDFCDHNIGATTDGWWQPGNLLMNEDITDEKRAERDAELKRLIEEGKA